MTKQEQIEEMAKEIEKAKKHIWASVMPQADYEDYLWHSRAIAEHLMLQGYRKADEVRKEMAKEILKRGKYCMPSGLRDWIKEQYGLEEGE